MTIEDVRRAAKREHFRAGVRTQLLMPHLSVRVTRWVVWRTNLSPNQLTMGSFVIGLGAAAAFATTNPWVVTAGLVAFHIHVLLDYVDGEVARCRSTASVRGAYLDLMTDRVTFPLLIFCSAVGGYQAVGDPGLLIAGFFAAFGYLADKEACDCWYRANAGVSEIEDRYVATQERRPLRRWLGWFALALVMSRSPAALLSYTTGAAFLDAAHLAQPVFAGSYRALVVWLFAALMPLGALARVLFVYWRGTIPRRLHLL